MERITSRKNEKIVHLRTLGADRGYRHVCGEFICDGEKLLREALTFGAEVTCVLVTEEIPGLPANVPVYQVPYDLITAVSPMKNPQPVLFSCRIPARRSVQGGRIIVLETVQDPGNLGTILRTANAFGVTDVCLTGACADLYNPKTVRATMGAVFRQNVVELDMEGVAGLKARGLRLLGTALGEGCQDICTAPLEAAAVVIGSEGQGLSREMLELCDARIIIPMESACESLNAGVAAAIVMWEMYRRGRG